MTLALTQGTCYSNLPRYGKDVSVYQKLSFHVKRFGRYSLNRHTQRQTDMAENITYPGGNDKTNTIRRFLPPHKILG